VGPKIGEGFAISKKSMKIAFTEIGPAKSSKLIMADLDISGGSLKLINQETILENIDSTCTAEAQDFL
jgi:hypothetical protein